MAERPVQRCAHDVYSGDPKEECVSGTVAALADVAALVPALAPVLALGLPSGPRRRPRPSPGGLTHASPTGGSYA